MTAPPSRRERLRAQTLHDILTTARRLLVEQGPAAVSLRPIARELGMTPAALYRYFPSLDDLQQALIVDLKEKMCVRLETARDAHDPDDIAGRMTAAARAFRDWAVEHKPEFTYIFTRTHKHPAPDGADCDATGMIITESEYRFGAIFLNLFAELWRRQGFPIPPDEALSPELRTQLAAFARRLPAPLPLGALYVFLECWLRLYGLVSMEVFGLLDFALSDPEKMFEAQMGDVGGVLRGEPAPRVDPRRGG